jgi:hypothetical protein
MSLRASFVLGFVLIVPASGMHAQVFKVEGGSSTLLNAEGGSVELKSPNYDSSLGGGLFEGRFELGAVVRYKYDGYSLIAGDDTVPFELPTDLFDGSHYFSARGLGISRSDLGGRFYALAGMTSTWVGTGFFQAAQSDTPVAIFFSERRLSKTIRFVSRNIVSSRQTSLQALEWQPRKWLKASLAGGIGSNQKYFASSFDAETEKLMIKASYVDAGSTFRRITVPGPLSSETDKGNVQALYRPSSSFSFSAGHQNILEPLNLQGSAAQASVSNVASDFHASGFWFGAGLFESSLAGRNTLGTNVYLGHRLGERLEGTANYFTSRPQGGLLTTILSGSLREKISQRFSILELLTRSNGQTTTAFGGDFISNRLNIRADYQNVYLPFRPDRPFQQALALNVGVRVWGPYQFTAASNVAPDGHLRYTFGASTYLYRYRGMMSQQSQSPDSFSLPKFLVEGMVKDTDGNPVEGAALRIGREVVFTDSSGHFLNRFRKHGPFQVKVVPDEFLISGSFEVVQAPPEVRADSEDRATDIVIVVRRLRPEKTRG